MICQTNYHMNKVLAVGRAHPTSAVLEIAKIKNYLVKPDFSLELRKVWIYLSGRHHRGEIRDI